MKKVVNITVLSCLSLAATAALLAACSGNGTDPQPTGPYSNGVFVRNEGGFFQNNGSLSWLTREGKIAETNVFQVRNKRPLTGGVQAYAEVGSRGLILVDNSTAGADKIEIVTADSLRSVKTLTDIENPRAIAKVSETKAYVTCYGATGSNPYFINPGYVAVIDLTTNTITKRIPMPKGPEGIAVAGGEAYIGTASYSGSQTILVIDTQADAIKQQIGVPTEVNRLEVDANNKLWGIAGKSLIRINPATKSIEATIPVGLATAANSPSGLTASPDRRSFYYKYTGYDANFNEVGQIFRFAITDATVSPTNPVINRSFVGFTGLGFDPKANVIYAGITPSYSQAGYVLRYQPTGQVIDSVRVEIAPSGFWFK